MNYHQLTKDPAFKGVVDMAGFNAEMYDALRDTEGVEEIRVWDDRAVQVPCVGTLAGFLAILRRLRDDPYPDHLWIICGVAGSAQLRAKILNSLYAWYREPWTHFPTLISPRAEISRLAKVSEEAVFVGAMAYVGPYVDIAAGVCLLPGAHVYHDSVIGEDTVMVGSAHVLGRAVVGPRVWLCAGVCVLPEANLPRDMVVTAGRILKGPRPGECP